MDIDAVGALCGEGDGERYQLFVFHRDGSGGHSGFVEGPESLHAFGCVRFDGFQLGEIFQIVHERS
jgi:hypothetical protein